MKIKRKNILKIAIDSPAAAGAGTLAKAISKHYNLLYLDTGKIYRYIAYLKIKYPKNFNKKTIEKKIKSLRIERLDNLNLLADEVSTTASIIAKRQGRGHIVLFADNPAFRAFWYGTNGLLLNAIFFGHTF